VLYWTDLAIPAREVGHAVAQGLFGGLWATRAAVEAGRVGTGLDLGVAVDAGEAGLAEALVEHVGHSLADAVLAGLEVARVAHYVAEGALVGWE
jgi:hypothetical protein